MDAFGRRRNRIALKPVPEEVRMCGSLLLCGYRRQRNAWRVEDGVRTGVAQQQWRKRYCVVLQVAFVCAPFYK